MGRACGYRILLQTAKFWGRGPHLASDDRVLLQITASRFRRPRFASDGRVLLQTAAFCFEALYIGSNLYEIDAFISYKKPLFHERRSEQSE